MFKYHELTLWPLEMTLDWPLIQVSRYRFQMSRLQDLPRTIPIAWELGRLVSRTETPEVMTAVDMKEQDWARVWWALNWVARCPLKNLNLLESCFGLTVTVMEAVTPNRLAAVPHLEVTWYCRYCFPDSRAWFGRFLAYLVFPFYLLRRKMHSALDFERNSRLRKLLQAAKFGSRERTRQHWSRCFSHKKESM